MTDQFAAEAALGTLINLTGKMRMLSHRAVMAAMQAALLKEKSASANDIYAQAITEFRQISDATHSGSQALGIPADVCELLKGAGAESRDIQGPIERFLNEAERIGGQVKTGNLDIAALATFSTFVASDLLVALNALNTCVSSTLREQLELQRETEQAARKAMMAAVKSVAEVSQKVKLISLNASVEAARAGEHGRGFAVIAQEIRALSEDASSSTQQIAGQLQKLA